MSLLLAADLVTLYPPGSPDERGWAGPGTVPVWSGQCNLQLGPGVTDPRAAEGGGAGPFGPARTLSGELYLPPEAKPEDGWTADVGAGFRYVLSDVRLVPDPAGAGLDCWVATATRDDTTDYG
jgi:hypothetical protein